MFGGGTEITFLLKVKFSSKKCLGHFIYFQCLSLSQVTGDVLEARLRVAL